MILAVVKHSIEKFTQGYANQRNIKNKKTTNQGWAKSFSVILSQPAKECASLRSKKKETIYCLEKGFVFIPFFVRAEISEISTTCVQI